MINYPAPQAIQHAINWNRAQMQRALRDSESPTIRVPRAAGPITPEQYRVVRLNDAARFYGNIQSLRDKL